MDLKQTNTPDLQMYVCPDTTSIDGREDLCSKAKYCVRYESSLGGDDWAGLVGLLGRGVGAPKECRPPGKSCPALT